MNFTYPRARIEFLVPNLTLVNPLALGLLILTREVGDMMRALERTFSRVENILTAIENGDKEATSKAIEIMAIAQPFDVLNIGQEFVADYLKNERANDDQLSNQLGLNQASGGN